jgi:protein-S-isoprenylcysteine O-methyltransferase Ste14
MSTSALIIVVVIAVVVVGAIALILRNRRSERLRNRFGPEYGRAIQETGS